MQTISSLSFSSDQDIPKIRQQAQQIAIWLDLSIWDQAQVITAVSEAAWAIFRHCGEGQVESGLTDHEGQQFLRYVVQSQAADQAEIAQNVMGELGAVRGLVDRFDVQLRLRKGVEVTLDKALPAEHPAVSPQSIQEWELELAAELPPTPLDEMRQRNRELLQLLAQLQDKEAALEQQLSETRRLEKARDELIHTMIHDLRNPLTSILTSLTGLLENETGRLSDYQRMMAEIAYLGTKKTVALVENILDVSRLEDNQITLDYAPISVEEVIDEVIRSQTLLAVERDIHLVSEVSGILPVVHGDRKIIERVLQNLVDNAIKFTPPGGFINIKAEPNGDFGDTALSTSQVSVSVLDNGPGISEELKGRLFEKFVTGSHEKSGSGLGLAFCKLAVEAHGGQIRVDSHPGQGAKFIFTLPLVWQDDPHIERPLVTGDLSP